MLCRSAVNPNNVESHSRLAGHHFANKESRAVVEDLAKGCHFGDREGRLPDVGPFGKLPAIPCFAGVQAHQCPQCGRLYIDMATVRRHFNKSHGSRAGVAFAQTAAQYLFQGKYGVLFAIQEVCSPQSDTTISKSATIGQALQARLAQALHDEFSGDWNAKDTWSYLKDVPWHHVLEANHDRYTVSDLKVFVTIPPIHTVEATGTLGKALALASQSFILGAERDVKQCDYRLRQWLGSDSNK